MIKILYLHILQADSTENWKAFCKLIVIDNYKISKKSKELVFRYMENITCIFGNLSSVQYSLGFFSPARSPPWRGGYDEKD